MNTRTYYSSIFTAILYGLGITALTATYIQPIVSMAGFIGLSVLMIGGVFACKADNNFLKILGYHLITVPMGILIGGATKNLENQIVLQAAFITLLDVALFSVAAIIKPNLFEKLGPTLFWCLVALILVRILGIFLPFDIGIVSYLAAALFSLYIGYDVWRASTLEKSWNSVVDVAVNLYLDIINLFLNLLQILSDNK